MGVAVAGISMGAAETPVHLGEKIPSHFTIVPEDHPQPMGPQEAQGCTPGAHLEDTRNPTSSTLLQ